MAGAAQRCPRRSRAPKSFKMTVFQSFSLGFPEGGRLGFPLCPPLERVVRAAQTCPRRSGAPKSIKTIAFAKLFVRVFRCESLGCSGALISVCSFHARNEEDNCGVWNALGVSFSGYLSFHARNEEENYSVWNALGVSFSGYFSFHARNDEDIMVSRVESGEWTVCSRRSGAPEASKWQLFKAVRKDFRRGVG